MLIRSVFVSLALVGCSAAAPPAPVLAGSQWVIRTIDDRPLESAPIDGVPRTPHLSFGARSYGGHAGCNALGGLFVERGGRVYTYPGPQTAMGCGGRRADQEAALDATLRAAPSVSREGDAVVLAGGGHRLRLARAEQLGPVLDPPQAWQGTAVAGQRFEARMIDGAWRTAGPQRMLRFTASTVTAVGFCPTAVTARYTQREGSIAFAFAATPCPQLAAFAGDRAAVSGPNGELLLGGNGHWLALDNLRRDRPK